jgi:HlyD family secretion protein
VKTYHRALSRNLSCQNTIEHRHPFTGERQVLRVLQEIEGIVGAGTPLFEIGDPSAIEVVVDVLTTDAVQIKPGASAVLERWGGSEELSAKARRVEPSAFTKVSALGVEEQRVNIILDIVPPANASLPLGDGFRVESKIVVFETKDALKVPAAALFRSEGGWAVFVVEGGTAKTKKVTLGRRTETEAIIESGLSEGETVILHPSDSVKDGVMVVAR